MNNKPVLSEVEWIGGINQFLLDYWGTPPTYYIRNTQYEKMQNEPNFIPKATTKHAKGTDFIPIFQSLFQLFTRQRPTFTQKYPKNARLLQFFETNILNSMYNKGLHKYSPQNTVSREEFTPPRSCGDKNAKRTQFPILRHANYHGSCVLPPVSFLPFYAKQSQFTYEHRVSGIEYRKNAKQTQFHSLRPRVTGDESR